MTIDEQLEKLLAGADTLLPKDGLRAKLEEGRPLRVKLGMDPTASSVTLGWAVVLRKLRDFQELGHTAVLIVGDFTAQVGDPSGKSETRKRLSKEEVQRYADNLLDQFSKVLLPDNLEIRYNSEWLAPLDMQDVLGLTSQVTVAQMLEREDFTNRFETNKPISLMEFMYPLLQGMDSVAVEADVELGGSDQLWNNMMGRTLQQKYGKPDQVVLTMPLLVGTDGVQKMSQSLGNYVGITDEPNDMFGKVMSIPDHLMESWFTLATSVPAKEVASLMKDLEDGSMHPGQLKRRLARSIVEEYHPGGGGEAEVAFDRIFKQHQVPDEVPEATLPEDEDVFLPAVLSAAGLVKSNGEARRLIDQGAVKIDGEPITTTNMSREDLIGVVLQVGKRRFLRLVE
jgi:tyrosyl-tRNA synthetase